MARYVKKPLPIEAIQWTGDNFSDVAAFLDSTPPQLENGDILIYTLEGVMHAPISSYIIRGIAGEYYPCIKSVFERSYERIDD